MSRQLRVAFVHQIDPRTSSSSWYGMLQILKRTFPQYLGPVTDLGPAPINPLPYRIASKVVRTATGKHYSFHHDPALARRIGRYFTAELARGQYDVVFAPAGAQVVAYLHTDLPVVYYSDATWRAVQGYYSDYSNTIARTRRGGDDLERAALQRADIIAFPSEWAARSAVEDYGIDRAKILINSIGANLTNPPRRADVLPRHPNGKLRLLLVGVSWHIKGADLAYQTLLDLLEMGLDAELTVVGCTAPEGVAHPRLKVFPFLDKQIPEQWERFRRLWLDADFFILPSRFEAAGIVLCEAAAYGLPAIATRTGGIPSLVRDGMNGYTIAPEEWAGRSARVIADVLASPGRYAALCESSRAQFEQRLNWDTWTQELARRIWERFPDIGTDGAAPSRIIETQ